MRVFIIMWNLKIAELDYKNIFEDEYEYTR